MPLFAGPINFTKPIWVIFPLTSAYLFDQPCLSRSVIINSFLARVTVIWEEYSSEYPTRILPLQCYLNLIGIGISCAEISTLFLGLRFFSGHKNNFLNNEYHPAPFFDFLVSRIFSNMAATNFFHFFHPLFVSFTK